MRDLVIENIKLLEFEREEASKLNLPEISLKSTSKRNRQTGLLPEQQILVELKKDKKKRKRDENEKAPKLSYKALKSVKLALHEELARSFEELLENLRLRGKFCSPIKLKRFESLQSLCAKALALAILRCRRVQVKTNAFISVAVAAMLAQTLANRNIAIIVPTIDLVRKTYNDVEKWKALFCRNLSN